MQAWSAQQAPTLQSISRREIALKYWPLIWSALARKPAEGLLTFLAVAAGFTLLSLMISMNLTAREVVAHSRMDRLFVDPLFEGPSGPGGLPLAIGSGMGAELRRPLGISIVGGLIVSQALTLYTTPVVYLYMDRLNNWVSKFGFARPPGETAPSPGVATP